MKLINIFRTAIAKFFLAIVAGFGLIKVYRFVAEELIDDEEDFHVYDEEHGHPLFV